MRIVVGGGDDVVYEKNGVFKFAMRLNLVIEQNVPWLLGNEAT